MRNLIHLKGRFCGKQEFFSQTKDGNGDVKGSHEFNSFFNTLAYGFEFPDGEIK